MWSSGYSKYEDLLSKVNLFAVKLFAGIYCFQKYLLYFPECLSKTKFEIEQKKLIDGNTFNQRLNLTATGLEPLSS